MMYICVRYIYIYIYINRYIDSSIYSSVLFSGGVLSEEEQGMFGNLPDLKFLHFHLHFVDRPPLS